MSALALFMRAYFNKRPGSMQAVSPLNFPERRRSWRLLAEKVPNVELLLNWTGFESINLPLFIFMKVPVFTSGHFHSRRGNAQAAPVGSLVSALIAVKVCENYYAASCLGLFVLWVWVLIQY